MQGSGLKNRADKEAFFRGVLRTGRALDTAEVDRTAKALARRTGKIWLNDRTLATEMSGVPEAERQPAPTTPAEASPAAAERTATEPAQEHVAEAAPAFDPFAFSAVVVMSRQGRDGLLGKLAEIGDVAHLRQLADAQHLAFDRSLTDVEALREAIVKGAEQRIADRRAAAS